MNLNADILFENLNPKFPAELSGHHTAELNLGRPEFYLDSSQLMEAGHLYLLPGDQFPRHLKMEKGCVILCAGNAAVANAYLDRCCLIRLRDRTDPFVLMNAVTAIYDRYSRWYDRLHQIVETTADLAEMTEATSRLFGNPIMVLDSEFRFVTTAGYSEGHPYIAIDDRGGEKLSLTAMNQFLSTMDMQIDETDPLHLDILGHSVLTYNLFDAEEYAGSVTLEYHNRPYAPGDEPLIRLFAHYLMLAMKQHTQFMSSSHSVLRKVCRNLLDDMPADPEDRRRLEQTEFPRAWRCMVLQPGEKLSKVPASYVCESLESLFPGSIAFSRQNNIVSFVPSGAFDNGPEARREYLRLLEEQFDADNLKVGISHDFSDVFSAKSHFTQALIALENGSIFDPEDTFYFFENYALEELIINAPNDQPLEMYYSEGLKRLFAHDENSATSYIETLHTYLNNNMNVTATATELYVHRSTLLERLSRIKKDLDADLEDPDVRLQLLILLKALDLRKKAFG